MIPTFNCAGYLREALEGVLAQDPGADLMQIEVVDDASVDDPASVVDEIGRGRVLFFRQPSNVGHVRNFATCLDRARGEIVHLLHGDDLVLPGFYEKLGKAFVADPDIGAAFCRWRIIDGEGREVETSEREQAAAGRLGDAVARLASEQRIVTPALAVRRGVWEKLGGFNPRLHCAEDWEMAVRIAAHYPIWYQPDVLAAYRSHAASNTGRNLRSAAEIGYSKLAIDLMRPLLPPERRREIIRAARRAYAHTALRNAERFAAAGDRAAMHRHLRMAFRLRLSPSVLRRAARLIVGRSRKR